MLEVIPYSVVVIAAVALSALCVLASLLHHFGRIVPERRAAPLLVLAIAAVLYGGTKPGSGLRSSPRPAATSRTAFTDEQLAAGFALAEARTEETHDFMPPPGAVIHEPWRKRGAHEDFISLPATNWSFPWGTATVSRATVLSSGEIGFDGWYSVSNRIAPFAASLGIVPEANWPLLGGGATNSLFWHAATSDSLTLTWLNALLDRDTNLPVSFQASLHRTGDFIFRYDLNASMLASNACIETFIDGVGEAYTNGLATTLRWASLAGLANDADFDGDGLSDADEVLLHFTNPRLADSDLDGLSDWQEVQTGTDPFDPDEDGDGVPDGVVPADWHGNSLWATNAAPDACGFAITLGSQVPAGETASLVVGGLCIPLRDPGTWTLGLVPGEPYDYRVVVNGETPVDLSIAPAGAAPRLLRASGDAATALFLVGVGATFDGFTLGGSGSMAVPAISLEWIDPGDGSHEDGTGVCLHAGDTASYSPWIRPGMLRDSLVLNGLGDNGDAWELSVSDTGVTHSGTATLPPDKTRFASVARVATAHRCDATRASPYCSVCGCAPAFNLSLDVRSPLTLKHHNQTAVRIVHENPLDSPHLGALIMIRRKGETAWDTLGYEADLDPWTARIAGTFELKGVAAIDGGLYETSIAEVEVRFPEYDEIRDDTNVIAFADAAWAATLADCIETNRKERGFWILLDTSNDTYVAGETKFGDNCRPEEQASVVLPVPLPDYERVENAIVASGIYTVASFHCHTPTTYRSVGRVVGPSNEDNNADKDQQVPGLVYDYLSSPPSSGGIPAGHPKDAPATIYISLGPERRPTP